MSDDDDPDSCNDTVDTKIKNVNSPEDVLLGSSLLGIALLGSMFVVWQLCSLKRAPPEDIREINEFLKRIIPPPMFKRESRSSFDKNKTKSVSGLLGNAMRGIAARDSGASTSGVKLTEIVAIPENPPVNNLDSLLMDIYVKYIKLKDLDPIYKVFGSVFQKLHQNMKKVDPYFQRYCETVKPVDNRYHNLLIKDRNHFIVEMAIDLPFNNTDTLTSSANYIEIEPKFDGFLQLKLNTTYGVLPTADGERQFRQILLKWRDENNYILQSKFTDWFKTVVNEAFKLFKEGPGMKSICFVKGMPYSIDLKTTRSAVSLTIMNDKRNINLDIDLIPTFKFPETRWPIGKYYREITEQCTDDYWMVVAKPYPGLNQERLWRIGMRRQERKLLLENSHSLLQALQLMKKLRDSQGMDAISNYHLKTLFLWEMMEVNNDQFWSSIDTASIFKIMLRRLNAALKNGRIYYYWNKHNNLIKNVDRHILDGYMAKLAPLLEIISQPVKYKSVAKYFLTADEFTEYNAKELHI